MTLSICLFDTIAERHVCDGLEDALRALGHKVHATGPIWQGHRFPRREPDIDTIRIRLHEVLAHKPDVLFVFRASTLTPELVRVAKKQGCMTVVWFPDDPVLYELCYRHVVDEYDLVLHCGPESILRFYAERGHQPGVYFPFWADPSSFPYCYNPSETEYDLVFLGNCTGPVRSARYDLVASLSTNARIYGRVDLDPHGLHGGIISDADNCEGGVTAALRKSRVALSIPQKFSSYQNSEYDFGELSGLGEFQLPSRIIQYAASGIPILSYGNPEIREIMPEVKTAQTPKDATTILNSWLDDPAELLSVSKKLRECFLRHFSAQARAQMLVQLVTGDGQWRRLSAADRARHFLQHPQEPIPPRNWLPTTNDDLPFDSQSWVRPTKASENWNSAVAKDGQLHVHFDLEGSAARYVHQDHGAFDSPPPPRVSAQLEPNFRYRVSVRVELAGISPSVEFWLIEYSKDKRLQHHRRSLSTGQNVIAVRTHRDAASFRIAIRFAGAGSAAVEEISLLHLTLNH